MPGLQHPREEESFLIEQRRTGRTKAAREDPVNSGMCAGYIWQRVPNGEWVPWWYLPDTFCFWEADFFAAGQAGSTSRE